MIWWILIIILIIFDLLLTENYTKLRGWFGEYFLKNKLSKLPKNYIVLNDIMIKDEWGTHQIDNIVISEYGIFVIELKFWYGFIIGNEFNEEWIRKSGKKKIYFHNPTYQNYGHIKALANLLNIDENKFISIICFANTTKLKIKSRNTIITKIDYINNIIKKYQNKILDNYVVIARQIENANITSKKLREYHNLAVNNAINSNKNLISKNLCPKCGHQLLKRKGKFGYFIGCSNYPRCKFTMHIDK